MSINNVLSLLTRVMNSNVVNIGFCDVGFVYQAKEDLKEITHKVYFDVEIDGKEAGIMIS